MPASTWIIKLILSHLVTDFILQPASWITSRNKYHYASAKLYLHGLATGLLAWIMIGWQYWPVALVIMITHAIIDGWKSYQKDTITWFLVDQLLHMLVLLGCWYFTMMKWADVQTAWQEWTSQPIIWKTVTAFVFLTASAGILIGQFTRQWREKIADAESLANAGKWIGIIERIIILLLVLQNQFSAIGLLVAAKGIIRFNEKDRPEIKTEYLVTGTLMSIGLALVTGLLLRL